MKLEQILQALTHIYLPTLDYPHTSPTSIRLFYGSHELTALDLDIFSLDPKLNIKRQCEFIRAQIQAMHFGINPAEEDSEEPLTNPLSLDKNYTDARRVSRPTRYLDGHIEISDKAYTYTKTPGDSENTKFSQFLKLALLQKIALNPEHNHPFIAFPLACEFNIQYQECLSKFPLRQGETLQEFLKSSTPSYQQWLNILISLYLILEQLTYLGLCFNISFSNLQVSPDTGYLKLINWETFTTTSDNSRTDFIGFFGPICYLHMFLHISDQLNESTHLTSQEHASLLSLTVNIMEVLRSNHLHFKNNFSLTQDLPTQSDLAKLNAEVLTALLQTLRMPASQESLSHILHSVDIPATQKDRILKAETLTTSLSEMSGKIDKAIEMGFKELVELLLITKTIAPTQSNERGETLLFRTCRFTQKFSYALLDLLINTYKADTNAQDNLGNTPLIANILNPHNPGTNLKTLLENGANPNLANHQGNTPLHFACALPPSDSIYLYASSATPSINLAQSLEKCSLTPLSSQNNTPSSTAINIIETLIAYGADPLTPNHEGLSPIDIARQSGFASLSKALSEI